jgi:glucose-6-phosphate 1-epimerase
VTVRPAELAGRFPVSGVEFFETASGLVGVRVARGGNEGELFLQGAQVTRWRPAGARPAIFTSGNAVFAPGKAIRGGVPVVFPWFGPHPSAPAAPQHGFARTAAWSLDAVAAEGADAVALTLSLVTDGASPWWPEGAAVTLRVGLGRELRLELAVENRMPRAIAFETALHTYLAVSDVAGVSIAGLEACGFIDKVAGGQRRPPAGAPLSLRGETDRVYLDTPETAIVHDPGWRRRILLRKQGAASTIVWNPWAEKAAAMADLGADQWQGMVCVETGNVADNRVRLDPGAVHRSATQIAVDAA